jgi:uncharacterized membrane protein
MALIVTTVKEMEAKQAAERAIKIYGRGKVPVRTVVTPAQREVSAGEVFVKAIYGGIFLGFLGFLVAIILGAMTANTVEIITLIGMMLSIVWLSHCLNKEIKNEEAAWEAKKAARRARR